jgi:hypothetical protein
VEEKVRRVATRPRAEEQLAQAAAEPDTVTRVRAGRVSVEVEAIIIGVVVMVSKQVLTVTVMSTTFLPKRGVVLHITCL